MPLFSHIPPKEEDPRLRRHPALKEERRARRRLIRMEPFRRKSLYVQLGLFAVIMALWWIPIVNPVKLLVVLFHELCHTFMAYATGGVVFGIAIDPGAAGVTLGMGGDEFWILAAGYGGSLAIGVVLYWLSAGDRMGEVWLGLCVGMGLSLVFNWLNDFTAVFGYGAFILMVIALFGFDPETKRFCVRVVATTSCLYPILDFMGDYLSQNPEGFLIEGKLIGSDTLRLAHMLGISAGFLSVAVALAGLGLVVVLVEWAAAHDAERDVDNDQKPKLRPLLPKLYNPNDPTDQGPTYILR